MIDKEYLNKIVIIIDSYTELKGCRVGFYGNGTSEMLSGGLTNTDNYNSIIVVIEDASISQANTVIEPKAIVANKTKLGAELKGMGLNCGFTAISALGVIGSAAAEVPTGGFATVLLVASWTGLVTSGAQCLNGIVRSAEAALDGDSNSLQRWDDNQIYEASFLIIDALGLLSGAVAIPQSISKISKIYSLLSTRGGLVSIAEFTKMKGPERFAALSKAIKNAMKAGVTEKQLVDALKNIDPAKVKLIVKGTKGFGKSKKALEAVAKITDLLAKELKSAAVGLSTAVSAPVFSNMSPEDIGSGSGSINWARNKLMSKPVPVNANALGVCRVPQICASQTIGSPKVDTSRDMNNAIIIHILPADE